MHARDAEKRDFAFNIYAMQNRDAFLQGRVMVRLSFTGDVMRFDGDVWTVEMTV